MAILKTPEGFFDEEMKTVPAGTVIEWPERQSRVERHKKPAPLPEPAVYYDRQDSRYPDRIRISFADGHTEIYDKRVNQPRPEQYVNAPNRRRRKP